MVQQLQQQQQQGSLEAAERTDCVVQEQQADAAQESAGVDESAKEDFYDGQSSSSLESDGNHESENSENSLPLMEEGYKPDFTFKVLLIGDSGVGKTCLVMRFIADKFEEHLPSTVGVDFAIKRMDLHDGLKVKCTIWDTAGQERFRALTSTFYRGAKGIIFVYDVTRRETLASLSDSWMAELEAYQPHPHVARMVVANKVDQHESREVSWEEGADFAKQHGCLFVETSAKQNIAVRNAFEELVLRILDTPSLLEDADDEEASAVPGINLAKPAADTAGRYAVSCSC